MNYAWIETSVMALIFIAAALFAIKYFMPELYAHGLRSVARKKRGTIDIHLVATEHAGSCQTKCSACNGCSKA